MAIQVMRAMVIVIVICLVIIIMLLIVLNIMTVTMIINVTIIIVGRRTRRCVKLCIFRHRDSSPGRSGES